MAVVFCIHTSLIWAPRLGTQTGIPVSERLDMPLTKQVKTLIKYTMLLSLLLLQFQLILFLAIPLTSFNFTNGTNLLSGIWSDAITKKKCTQHLQKYTFLTKKFIKPCISWFHFMHGWRITAGTGLQEKKEKRRKWYSKAASKILPKMCLLLLGRYKAFVCYIFARSICMSEREHLLNKEKCFFISLRKLFLFLR